MTDTPLQLLEEARSLLAVEAKDSDAWTFRGQAIAKLAARIAACQQSEAYAEHAARQEDADRWRALLNSERIRPLGSAGLAKDTLAEHPRYAHLGVEIWSVYRADRSIDNTIGKRWLTAYADICRGKPRLDKA